MATTRATAHLLELQQQLAESIQACAEDRRALQAEQAAHCKTKESLTKYKSQLGRASQLLHLAQEETHLMALRNKLQQEHVVHEHANVWTEHDTLRSRLPSAPVHMPGRGRGLNSETTASLDLLRHRLKDAGDEKVKPGVKRAFDAMR